MKYPKFIQKGQTIGVCAPSAGVGRKLEDFDRSISYLKKLGYSIKETESVRVNNLRSTNAVNRGMELNELFQDDSVSCIMCAAGGDFLDEMIPYADFDLMKQKPKWLYGMSDPTGILFPYTCMCDVATIYGSNAGSFDVDPLPEYLKVHSSFLNNADSLQYSFPYHVKDPFSDTFNMNEKTELESNVNELHVQGRCIGGCIDVLKDLIGTRFDHTQHFLNRYKKDGIIWYFDNFCLSAEALYRTFLQFSYAGWFENTKAVLIGRTAIPSSETGMNYAEAILTAFKDIPVIFNADIGHVPPTWVMINGAVADVNFKNKNAKISFQLI